MLRILWRAFFMLADQIIQFYSGLHLPEAILPGNVSVMYSPGTGKTKADTVAFENFIRKYYRSEQKRIMLCGINPGRFGAGITGIPFTDPVKLRELNLPWSGPLVYEPSSAFVYKVIDSWGGPDLFYRYFYFSSVSPLGFTRLNDKGKHVNFNYYDHPDFILRLEPWIDQWMQTQLSWNLRKDICFCIGSGKNAKIMTSLNKKYQWFEHIESLPHPRYIMQYKFRELQSFVDLWKQSLIQYVSDVSRK